MESAGRARLPLVRLLLLAGAALILIFGALNAVLDHFLYWPTPEVSRADTRSVRLKSENETLKVWELHPDAQAALIYFGGNAEDVSANIPDFDKAVPERAVYLVNYRGYGGSSGRPSESGLTSDAQTVFDWVAARHTHIAVIGRSLGSGVATALAAHRPVERLVLVTPFDTIANVASDHVRWLPIRWLMRDRYDSTARMSGVHAPILVIVAGQDEVVFRTRSDALIASIPPGQRRTILVPEATHNDINTFSVYWRSLKEFLQAPASTQ